MNDEPATLGHVTDVPRTSAEEVDETGVHTSFSRLSTYLRCPAKYFLKYELGLKAPPTMRMSRGKAGHHALEVNGRHKIATGQDLPVDQVLQSFDDRFTGELILAGDEAIQPGDDPGKAKDETIESLRYYMIREAPHITPVAIELEFLTPFPQTEDHHEPIPPLKGFIDTIQRRMRTVVPRARPVERTELLDRKFPARKPSDSQARAELSDQLNIYDGVLTAAGNPTDDIGFENHIPATKTLPPRVEYAFRLPEHMTPAARANRIARSLFKLRRMYQQIRQAPDNFLPVDDPRVCGGCEFRKRCQYSLAADDYVAEKLTPQSFQL